MTLVPLWRNESPATAVYSVSIGQNIQKFAYTVKYIWFEKWTLVKLISHAHEIDNEHKRSWLIELMKLYYTRLVASIPGRPGIKMSHHSGFCGRNRAANPVKLKIGRFCGPIISRNSKHFHDNWCWHRNGTGYRMQKCRQTLTYLHLNSSRYSTLNFCSYLTRFLGFCGVLHSSFSTMLFTLNCMVGMTNANGSW